MNPTLPTAAELKAAADKDLARKKSAERARRLKKEADILFAALRDGNIAAVPPGVPIPSSLRDAFMRAQTSASARAVCIQAHEAGGSTAFIARMLAIAILANAVAGASASSILGGVALEALRQAAEKKALRQFVGKKAAKAIEYVIGRAKGAAAEALVEMFELVVRHCCNEGGEDRLRAARKTAAEAASTVPEHMRTNEGVLGLIAAIVVQRHPEASDSVGKIILDLRKAALDASATVNPEGPTDDAPPRKPHVPGMFPDPLRPPSPFDIF